MSNKSTGSHLLVPDEEVKEYSEQLNSYYEMLHRIYSSLLKLPDDISSIKLLMSECHKMFYAIRDLLEEDYAIHPYTAEVLEVPECVSMLKQLTLWNENFETSKKKYIVRQKDEKDAIQYNGEYTSFWKEVSLTLVHVERCLRITRSRVKSNNNKYPLGLSPPRYPWV